MSWNFSDDRPIYIQLMEKIQLKIICGAYKPGEKLPSVRDIASEASVNPNTMQKALSELERLGLVKTERTTGRFITDDKEKIQAMKKELAAEEIATFLETMKALGFSKEDVIQLINENN